MDLQILYNNPSRKKSFRKKLNPSTRIKMPKKSRIKASRSRLFGRKKNPLDVSMPESKLKNVKNKILAILGNKNRKKDEDELLVKPKEKVMAKKKKATKKVAKKAPKKKVAKKAPKKKVAKKATKKKVAKKATKKVAKKAPKKKVAKKATKKVAKKVAKKATEKVAKEVAPKKARKKAAKKAGDLPPPIPTASNPKKKKARKVRKKKGSKKKSSKKSGKKKSGKKKSSKKSGKKKSSNKVTYKKATAKKSVKKKSNPKSYKKKNYLLKNNPIGGAMSKVSKFTKNVLAHDLGEAGGLLAGGAAIQGIRHLQAKFAPQLSSTIAKIPLIGGFIASNLDSIIPLALGAVAHKYVKNANVKMLAKGVIGASVVGIGSKIYASAAQMAGANMAGIIAVPSMNGIIAVPSMNGFGAMRMTDDFGAAPASISSADFGAYGVGLSGEGGYLQSADFDSAGPRAVAARQPDSLNGYDMDGFEEGEF
jgi:hypothetical protein